LLIISLKPFVGGDMNKYIFLILLSAIGMASASGAGAPAGSRFSGVLRTALGHGLLTDPVGAIAAGGVSFACDAIALEQTEARAYLEAYRRSRYTFNEVPLASAHDSPERFNHIIVSMQKILELPSVAPENLGWSGRLAGRFLGATTESVETTETRKATYGIYRKYYWAFFDSPLNAKLHIPSLFRDCYQQYVESLKQMISEEMASLKLESVFQFSGKPSAEHQALIARIRATRLSPANECFITHRLLMVKIDNYRSRLAPYSEEIAQLNSMLVTQQYQALHDLLTEAERLSTAAMSSDSDSFSRHTDALVGMQRSLCDAFAGFESRYSQEKSAKEAYDALLDKEATSITNLTKAGLVLPPDPSTNRQWQQSWQNKLVLTQEWIASIYSAVATEIAQMNEQLVAQQPLAADATGIWSTVSGGVRSLASAVANVFTSAPTHDALVAQYVALKTQLAATAGLVDGEGMPAAGEVNDGPEADLQADWPVGLEQGTATPALTEVVQPISQPVLLLTNEPHNQPLPDIHNALRPSQPALPAVPQETFSEQHEEAPVVTPTENHATVSSPHSVLASTQAARPISQPVLLLTNEPLPDIHNALRPSQPALPPVPQVILEGQPAVVPVVTPTEDHATVSSPHSVLASTQAAQPISQPVLLLTNEPLPDIHNALRPSQPALPPVPQEILSGQPAVVPVVAPIENRSAASIVHALKKPDPATIKVLAQQMVTDDRPDNIQPDSVPLLTRGASSAQKPTATATTPVTPQSRKTPAMKYVGLSMIGASIAYGLARSLTSSHKRRCALIALKRLAGQKTPLLKPAEEALVKRLQYDLVGALAGTVVGGIAAKAA